MVFLITFLLQLQIVRQTDRHIFVFLLFSKYVMQFLKCPLKVPSQDRNKEKYISMSQC